MKCHVSNPALTETSDRIVLAAMLPVLCGSHLARLGRRSSGPKSSQRESDADSVGRPDHRRRIARARLTGDGHERLPSTERSAFEYERFSRHRLRALLRCRLGDELDHEDDDDREQYGSADQNPTSAHIRAAGLCG